MAKAARSVRVDSAWLEALQKTEPERLYVFFGPETFRRDTALAMLRGRLCPDGAGDPRYLRLEGRAADARTLSEAVDTLSFSGDRRLIEVWDLDATKAAWLEPIVSDLPPSVCLVFVYDTIKAKPDARTKLYGLLTQAGTVAEFEQASPGELSRWIAYRFRRLHGKRIAEREIEYLVFQCGGLMANLASEIDKLGAYAAGPAVTRGDIDAAASRVPQAQVFSLADALARDRIAEALRILADLEALRTAPLLLLAALGRQIRQLYAARLALTAGKGRADVMRLCGLKWPSHADMLLDTAARLPLSGLRRCLVLCAEADFGLKSSRAEPYDSLRLLLLALRRALRGQEEAGA